MEAPLLTTEQVATLLSVSPGTVARLVRNGELPAVRVGQQWRFKPQDIRAFIAHQTVDASHAPPHQQPAIIAL